MRSLAAAQAEQQRNREAESAHVRRTVWGESGAATTEADTGEEDMANTILGDVTHPAPIIMPPPQQSSPVATAALMMLGLAAGGAAGGAAGYLLAGKQPEPAETAEPVSLEDGTVSIGLGRIEDYLGKP